MPRRKRATYVNQQQRATEFQVGQAVVHWGHSIEQSGRVTEVWPAIGQVDVQFPWGNIRVPVEDLQIVADNTWVVTPKHEDTPGGQTVPVPGGPYEKMKQAAQPSAERVVMAYVKKAIYWHQKDRKYRVSQGERDSGHYHGPKCRDAENPLRNAIYKRENGQSVKLLGCPVCLFLVKREDLLGIDDAQPAPEPDVALPKGRSTLIRLLREE